MLPHCDPLIAATPEVHACPVNIHRVLNDGRDKLRAVKVDGFVVRVERVRDAG